MALNYDPDKTPNPGLWLAADEGVRRQAIAKYHRRARIHVPKLDLHVSAHIIAENRLALGVDVDMAAYLRLVPELGRHETIHALSFVMVDHIASVMREDPTDLEAALAALTAESWRAGLAWSGPE